jgi:hypothetical protein
MAYLRKCTRLSCGKTAMATLTYVYAESTAVLGPLATVAEPHCYDLCEVHARKLTAPLGWEIVRLETDPEDFNHSPDDLLALANAVREAAKPQPSVWSDPNFVDDYSRRAHLRVVRDEV